MKRPLGVAVISFYYIFGALVLLYTAIFNNGAIEDIGMAARLGLENVPEQPVRIALAIFSLIMVIGYGSLKVWGFWLMLAYSVVFGGVSLLLALEHSQQPYIGNFIWSLIVLVYTLYVRNHFFERKTEGFTQ
ncbi:hypothetical protein [Mesobacillus harenae]|uniref:hypothetical protein n=1 Tax=Mesobacillus harenae TaxID=2213203 RepID=UPI00158037CB